MTDVDYDAYAQQFGFSLQNPMGEAVNEHVNLFVYGAPGAGKTGLAVTAPNPILIDFEHGGQKTARRVLQDLAAAGWPAAEHVRIVSIDMEEGGRTNAIAAVEKLHKVLSFLQTPHHPFQTVILDPIGEFQRLMTQWVIESFPVKRAMGNQPGMQDWGKMGSESLRILQAFRALPMTTIFVAHSSQPQTDQDEVKPKIQGNLIGPWIEGAVDVIGYLHKVTTEEQGIVRVLRTDGNGSIRAKNRGNRLDELEYYPNLTSLLAKMNQ